MAAIGQRTPLNPRTLPLLEVEPLTYKSVPRGTDPLQNTENAEMFRGDRDAGGRVETLCRDGLRVPTALGDLDPKSDRGGLLLQLG